LVAEDLPNAASTERVEEKMSHQQTAPSPAGISVPKLLRSMLDAIPSMVMVVDEGFRVFEMNSTARTQLQPGDERPYQQTTGETLHCIHARKVGEECGGQEACRGCLLRRTIAESFETGNPVEREVELTRETEGGVEVVRWRATSTPLTDGGGKLAVLVLQDLTPDSEKRELISMCAECKKIRNGEESWETLEEYLSRKLGVDISHTFCPHCLRKLYPGYGDGGSHSY
jgi:PAS domain-containing protein